MSVSVECMPVGKWAAVISPECAYCTNAEEVGDDPCSSCSVEVKWEGHQHQLVAAHEQCCPYHARHLSITSSTMNLM